MVVQHQGGHGWILADLTTTSTPDSDAFSSLKRVGGLDGPIDLIVRELEEMDTRDPKREQKSSSTHSCNRSWSVSGQTSPKDADSQQVGTQI